MFLYPLQSQHNKKAKPSCGAMEASCQLLALRNQRRTACAISLSHAMRPGLQPAIFGWQNY